ncbi:DEKNAAC100104 [Brettanomyces naardenensis]|uniref:DEKNAAC100104 n=1 Tax=Brettanomyces naardenensis TaxID=13370 RepID=A0A448YEL7_BRENA|nr:DEKNAAC100104 [Brettanomyces naardenensis]
MQLSLTVEETNKLRIQVGLIPIPIEGKDAEHGVEGGIKAQGGSAYTTKVVDFSSNESDKKFDSLRKSLSKAKNDLLKEKYISRGGILDRISTDENRDEKEWLSGVGKKVHKKKRLRFKKKEEVNVGDSDTEGLNVAHNSREFKEYLEKGGEVVLTLKDKSVNDESADEDELENPELAEKQRIRQSLKERSKGRSMDLGDEEQPSSSFKLGASDGLNGDESTEHLEQPKSKLKRKLIIFDDSDDDDDELVPKSDYSKPKKIKKIKRSDRDDNEKRRKRRDNFALGKEAFKKIELVNEDLENEDSHELNSFMSATRKTRQEGREIVKNVSELVPTASSEERAEESDDGLVVDEDLEFLSRIDTRPSDGDERGEKEIWDVEDEPEGEQNPKSSAHIERIGKILNDAETSNSGSLGISAALKLFESEGSDKSGKSANGINLVYTDDNGKVLSPKEAYKYLSHKFHGFKKR